MTDWCTWMQVMQHKWVQQGPHWQGSLATSTFSVAGMPFTPCSRLLAVALHLLPLNSCLLHFKGALSFLASHLDKCWGKKNRGGEKRGQCQDTELHTRFLLLNKKFTSHARCCDMMHSSKLSAGSCFTSAVTDNGWLVCRCSAAERVSNAAAATTGL